MTVPESITGKVTKADFLAHAVAINDKAPLASALPATISSAAKSDRILGTALDSDVVSDADRWQLHADGRTVYAPASTVLTADSAIGDTNIATARPIPKGSIVVIGSETRTVTKCVNSIAPYWCTLAGGGLAGAHAAGDRVAVQSPVGGLELVALHVFDEGVTPPIDLGWVPALHTRMAQRTEGLQWNHGQAGGAVQGSNAGYVTYSGDLDFPAFFVSGRLGEESCFGTAQQAGFFSDSQAGDTVVRSFMGRVLIGASNGLTMRDAQIVVTENRSVKLARVLELGITPASLGLTTPALPTGASGWQVLIDPAGAYKLVPTYDPTNLVVPPAFAELPAPAGASIANGSHAARAGTGPSYGPVYDSFAGDGALGGRVTDTGQVWTQHVGAFSTVSGFVTAPVSGGSSVATLDVGGCRGVISADISEGGVGTTSNVGIVFCYVDDSNYLLLLAQRKSINAWQLLKQVGGVFTVLGGIGDGAGLAPDQILTPRIAFTGDQVFVTNGPAAQHTISYTLDDAEQALFYPATRLGLFAFSGADNEQGTTRIGNLNLLPSDR